MLSSLHTKVFSLKRLSIFQVSMLVLGFLLVCRIFAMYFVPLNDSTEARYGEIARIMQASGNWVTPMHMDGVPFWAKPPLSTWTSALSIKLFGLNEFAVRFPALLFSIGILWLVFSFVKKHSGESVATLATLVLAGSIYFYLDAGTVMTDPSLLFCTTLMEISFWQAVVNRNHKFEYWFFIGAGLGLLAKGPVALVLVGMPIFIWVLWRKQWRALWQNLPWIKGVLLMLLIALPWYVMAELRTPGFLNYFIVGEHIKRFLQPGWNGDLYGYAHLAPYGMIWVYALMGIFPWTIPLLIWLPKQVKKLPALTSDNDGWASYLLLCFCIPLLFFTFASNIIYPYVFPSLPTFAIWFAEMMQRSKFLDKKKSTFVLLATISGSIFLALTIVFILKPELVAKSQDRVVAAFESQNPDAKSHLIYWTIRPDYSAQFYSEGRALGVHDVQALCKALSEKEVNYLALETSEINNIAADILAQLQEITKVKVLSQNFTIYKSKAIRC